VWRSDSVATAFQKMINNNILSVPVYDQVRRSFTHFIDMVDVVAFAVARVTEQQASSDFIQFMDIPLLQTVNCGEVSDLSKRDPFFPVESGAPLLEAMNLMVKWGVHRIPIVDAEGELMTIISQSQLSAFIYKYLSSFSPSLFKQTAASIAIPVIEQGTSTNIPAKVISVGLRDRAIDAFITMHEKRISGVAVIDDDGIIVGNVSASDLKAIGHDGILLTRLFYPVSEFLKLICPHGNTEPSSELSRDEKQTQALRYTPPAIVPTTATFGAVLGTLVLARIHRVYVVDEQRHPVGVIGYAEILRAVYDDLLRTTGSLRSAGLVHAFY